MKELFTQLPLLLQGLWMTLQLWLGATLIGLLGGLLIAIATLLIKNKLIQSASRGYIFLLRAVPVYVQVLIIYFVLPDLLYLDLSAFSASIIALGLCSSAYVAEIIRTGVNGIGPGQWEAAQTLGLSGMTTIGYIILPQVGRIIIPSIGNELESLIKSTAILSAIGVVELTKAGSNIIAQYMNPVPIYLVIALFYALISCGLNITIGLVEKRIKLE